MIGQIAAVIYFFLPAGVANMAPVVLTKLFGQGAPISERFFGNHKSWRGLIGGTIAGFLFFMAQRLIDHQSVPMMAGLLMSAGALLGDLIKSFFKRLRHLPPGTAWIPFDQLDYVAGAIIATRLVVPLTVQQIATAIIAFVLLHFIVSGAGYLLRMKERPI